jgi:hypothetical protein
MGTYANTLRLIPPPWFALQGKAVFSETSSLWRRWDATSTCSEFVELNGFYLTGALCRATAIALEERPSIISIIFDKYYPFPDGGIAIIMKALKRNTTVTRSNSLVIAMSPYTINFLLGNKCTIAIVSTYYDDSFTWGCDGTSSSSCSVGRLAAFISEK